MHDIVYQLHYAIFPLFIVGLKRVSDMKRFRSARLLLICAIMGLLPGCESIKQELNHSGGAVGHHMDEILPAQTKNMQVYRAAFAMALLAQAGTRTVKSSDGAADYVYALSRLANNIRSLNVFLKESCQGTAGQNYTKSGNNDIFIKCNLKGFYSEFESMIPELEEYTYKFALSVVPRSKIIESGGDFLKQDYIAIGAALIGDGGQVLDIFHTTAAAYRAGKEGLAALCKVHSEKAPGKVVYDNMKKVNDDLELCLKTSKGSNAGVDGDGVPAFPLKPEAEDFLVLSRMSFRSCVNVATQSDDQLTLLLRCVNEVHLVDEYAHTVPDSVLIAIKGVDFSSGTPSLENYCKLVGYNTRSGRFAGQIIPEWIEKCKPPAA